MNSVRPVRAGGVDNIGLRSAYYVVQKTAVQFKSPNVQGGSLLPARFAAADVRSYAERKINILYGHASFCATRGEYKTVKVARHFWYMKKCLPVAFFAFCKNSDHHEQILSEDPSSWYYFRIERETKKSQRV